MKKLIVVCATLLIVLTAGIGGDAFAKSKKYYEYKLKARPAGGIFGRIGDHTYVCIKKLRRKGGKWCGAMAVVYVLEALLAAGHVMYGV